MSNRKSGALVTVRTSSTRLPNKCLQPIVDGISAIQVVIRRAKKVGCQVVLTTTLDASDDKLFEIAKKEGVECFRGAVRNKIKRWADCFKEFGFTEGLLVDGDDPTFDFNVGARAVKQLCEGRTDMVVIHPEMTPGFFTYGLMADGMAKLLLQAPDGNTDTDVITEFISRAGLSKAPVSVLPEETEGHDVRLTIDYQEDVDFYRALYSKVNYLANGPEVVRVAKKYELQKINWFRQDEFLENQRKFNENVRKGIK